MKVLAVRCKQAGPSRGSDDHVEMTVPSPVRDVKIVSPISTFVLNTLTLKKCVSLFFFFRRTVEKERDRQGWNTWAIARQAENNRQQWREDVQAFCVSWREETNYGAVSKNNSKCPKQNSMWIEGSIKFSRSAKDKTRFGRCTCSA